MKKNNKKYFIISLLLVLSFSIIQPLSCGEKEDRLSLKQLLSMFQHTISLIQNHYVEEVDMEEVIEGAIKGMLKTLDPHCSFISREEHQRFEEDFTGEFFGVGISYDIIDGILTIISPIKNSPAEKAGIKPGDQVIKINGSVILGESKENLIKKLTGKLGSEVTLTIMRNQDEFDITLKRSKIEIASVPLAYFVDDTTGYIRITTFSRKTGSELKSKLENFEKRGVRRLIMDLRTNTGGLLDQALETAGFFLPEGREIVSTKGRSLDHTKIHKALKGYKFPSLPIIVLIDHGSASASEIVSGALQDWDRALIVGKRSFGKGLVQQEFPIGFGASVLLTIEKYYTPSGRLIQRDYSQGYYDYYMDALDDSLYKRDENEIFYTKGKRKVFGGGGISPDKQLNWINYNKTLEKIIYHPDRLFFQFTNKICNESAIPLENITIANISDFVDNDSKIVSDFFQFIEKHQIEYKDDYKKYSNEIRARVKKEIVAHYFNENKADSIYHHNHEEIKTVLSLFSEAETLIAPDRNQ